MNSKRLHLVLICVIALLMVGLVAGAYGVNNLLGAESSKLAGNKAKGQALLQEETALKKAKKDIAKYAELEKITRSVVPEDKNQAEAVREIVNIAAANGINLASITFPASTLGTSPSGAPITAAPAPSASAGPSASTKSLSQLLPVKNISGVYQLPITVVSDTDRPVAYSKFINFLSDLEHNRRTAQVASITLDPDTANRNLINFTLILTEYIKP
jgi:hypothetical protein